MRLDGRKLRGNLMMLLAAAIWGAAFVAQSIGMDYIGALTFSVSRYLIGGLVLLPVIFLMGRRRRSQPEPDGTPEERKKAQRTLWFGGILCGVILFTASTIQQYGLVYTTAGKAGFITALYIVLVPVFGIFLKKRVPALIWLCVAIAVAGLYLLCITDGFSIGTGDLLVLVCAVIFSLHILVIDHFSPKVDGVKMSCIQFFTAAALGIVPMFVLERPSMAAVLSAWAPLLYVGVLSSGVAYTLQILAQRHTDPTVASLVMSTESVFAVLAGFLILQEQMSARELAGCVLMMAAILLSQLPIQFRLRRRKQLPSAE